MKYCKQIPQTKKKPGRCYYNEHLVCPPRGHYPKSRMNLREQLSSIIEDSYKAGWIEIEECVDEIVKLISNNYRRRIK